MDRLGLYVNKLYVGLIVGLLGPAIGFFIFYAITSSDYDLGILLHRVLSNGEAISGLISVSAIFNLALFFLALKKDYLRTGQGVILATFIYAIIIVYIKYLA